MKTIKLFLTASVMLLSFALNAQNSIFDKYSDMKTFLQFISLKR